MAKRKPWYDVGELREDLRENRPLDASEFAIHLDQIRDGRAHKDSTDPERFFDRTCVQGKAARFAGQVWNLPGNGRFQTCPITWSGSSWVYFCKAAWAAARRAIGTRKGLQLT
jgi:hypothetical protein